MQTMKSETIGALSAALAKAQGEMKPAAFNKVNPHFKSRYADLASIMAACQIALSKNGLAIIQMIHASEKGPCLETMLSHSSGEYICSYMPLLVTKQDMQGLGSALTYARRYAISAMVGISADEDDDGNAAAESPRKTISDKKTPEKFMPGEKERDEVRRLGAARGFTNEQIANIISTRFAKEKLVQLTKNEYDDLLATLDGGSFNQ